MGLNVSEPLSFVSAQDKDRAGDAGRSQWTRFVFNKVLTRSPSHESL
jgi:hypothetical protein